MGFSVKVQIRVKIRVREHEGLVVRDDNTLLNGSECLAPTKIDKPS